MAKKTPLPSLTPSMEDYLEVIYHLERERRMARVRDIAAELKVKMSSVSSALKGLAAKGLIDYDPGNYITLTREGDRKAEEIVRKHEILKDFLVSVLRVDEDLAEENACRMEHSLDPEVIEQLVNYLEFFKMCPVDQTTWGDERAGDCSECDSCLEEAMKRVRLRAKRQEDALAGHLTLAEAPIRSHLVVEAVTGSLEFQKFMAEQGLNTHALIEIEEKDEYSNSIRIGIQGRHVSLATWDASKILVKPL